MSLKNVLIVMVFVLMLTACDTNNLVELVPTEKPDLSLEYQPPFVPVTFVINENGISVGSGVSMVTPIGRFGIGADYPVAEFGKVTLVLKDNNRAEVEVFHVVVEDDVQIVLEGRAIISVGRDGVMTIDITEGQLQSIVFTNEAPPSGDMGIVSAGDSMPPITVSMDETGVVSFQ